MKYKTHRQKRYQLLLYAGFLGFEARELSKVPSKVPYMKKLINERMLLFRRATRLGWGKGKYAQSIKAMYRGKGWARGSGRGRVKYDPWAVLRSYEDEHKDKVPEYVSPWQPKQKRHRDFEGQFDRGESKYPRGRYYK